MNTPDSEVFLLDGKQFSFKDNMTCWIPQIIEKQSSTFVPPSGELITLQIYIIRD